MERAFVLPLSELIDRMTVTQIKTIMLKESTSDFNSELEKLKKDISSIINAKNHNIDGEFIQSIVILSQINLHIWNLKDQMQEHVDEPDEYLRLLKYAHQLNGYRNKVRNSILYFEGVEDKSLLRSNVETDGLNIDILKR